MAAEKESVSVCVPSHESSRLISEMVPFIVFPFSLRFFFSLLLFVSSFSFLFYLCPHFVVSKVECRSGDGGEWSWTMNSINRFIICLQFLIHKRVRFRSHPQMCLRRFELKGNKEWDRIQIIKNNWSQMWVSNRCLCLLCTISAINVRYRLNRLNGADAVDNIMIHILNAMRCSLNGWIP